MLKNLLKYLGYYTLFLITLVFITSLLNLIGVNSTITNLLIFIFNISLFFIFGLKNGKKASNKGYLAGLKVGGLFLLVLIIISLFTSKNIFSLSTFIYYLVLILASTLGGSLGINKKSE
ncbi:TIGR04086 family membrane protein [bacterium]|nr:TIGR04086 family membrane protein [bacterium]